MAHVQNLCRLQPYPVRPERSVSEVEGRTALSAPRVVQASRLRPWAAGTAAPQDPVRGHEINAGDITEFVCQNSLERFTIAYTAKHHSGSSASAWRTGFPLPRE